MTKTQTEQLNEFANDIYERAAAFRYRKNSKLDEFLNRLSQVADDITLLTREERGEEPEPTETAERLKELYEEGYFAKVEGEKVRVFLRTDEQVFSEEEHRAEDKGDWTELSPADMKSAAEIDTRIYDTLLQDSKEYYERS